MSDIRYNGWLHRSGTGGVWQDSSGNVGIGTSVGMTSLINSGPNALTFGTGATPAERLRITSSGQVLIGIDNAVASDVSLQLHSATSGTGPILNMTNDTGDCRIFFGQDNSSGSANSKGQIRYNVANNYLTAHTAGSERLRIDPDGNFNITGITTAKTFVPTEGQLSHRNLIINGAVQVSQRASTSTSTGYCVVDRFGISNNGLDEATTNSHHDLTSSDTGPWAEGFRHSFHVQNGNQTGGAGVDDRVAIQYKLEAQDIANSGWNYASSSSYITLSFWVKSSVAQNFYGRFTTEDGTSYSWPFETGSLTANTWKKVTKIIPGNANLAFDNDVNIGVTLEWNAFRGTNKTGSLTLDTWAAFQSTVRVPDMTSTWYTTNNATFEITGVQLEVGSAATPFEHRTYGNELALCQRYHQRAAGIGAGYGSEDGYARSGVVLATQMRAAPTVTLTNTGSGSIIANAFTIDGGYVTYGSLGSSGAGIFTYVLDSEI